LTRSATGRRFAALAIGAVLLAGCASQQPSSPAATTENPAIAKANADEAKARAAEAKAKAEEARAKAEKARADASSARSAAARAAKAPAESSAGSASVGSSYRSPTVVISCNPDNYATEVHFGGDWDFSTSTATLFIDYGDGRSYTTSHIPYFRSAYRHSYRSTGNFLVSIRLTDGRGNVATDSCATGVWIGD
jgi:nucleoid-associated protein YgaU